jgi:putative ABC transport system permease protein
MLVAKSSVDNKITSVKSNAGTSITISPAGVSGFAGGGDPLTSDQLAAIKNTANIVSTSATLSDQMGTSDTNLTASLEMGSFGQRQQRFENNSNSSDTRTTNSSMPMPTPRTSATGTTNPNSVSTNGSSLNITSGTTIDGNSSDLVALVGSDIATKNNLSVGSTFTAYSKTITVSGIFKTDNKFQDSGIIMPLATVQSLTSQTGSVSSVTAKVNSSDNVDAVVTSLKSSLGDKADIVSEAQQAADSVSSLESISSIALMGVIGATIAGAIIVLIAMIMIVRERRREIGVIKAIGGSDKKVISQFITEALTLTVIGSIIGLSLGVIVSGPMTTSLVSNQENNSTISSRPDSVSNKQPGMMGRGMEQISNSLTQITSSVTPQTFAMAIGITFVIAIVGSATPAWFIAKIRPAEVLRSE